MWRKRKSTGKMQKIKNKRMMVALLAIATMLFYIQTAVARTFDFKAVGTKGSSSGGMYWYSDVEKKKSALFQVKVGSAGKIDNKSKMEIRAATVFKNAKDKKTGVNDVAVFSFDPVNAMKPLFFIVATGTAKSRTDRYWVDSSRSSGWQVAGVIIEIWQDGKVVKHWTNIPGNGGKAKLTEDVDQLFIHEDGYNKGEYNFDNATEIFSVNQKGEKADIEDLLKECAAPEEDEKPDSSKAKKADEDASDGGNSEDISNGEFVIKSFCGFEFGSKKPAFSSRNNEREITLRRPFRHYTSARLEYGANSGLLQSITLYSRQRFDSDMERTEAAAAATAVIEKKFGITLEDCGGSFRYCDDRVEMWVQANHISVRRRDLQEKDEMLRNAIREATKRQIRTGGNVDDGSDVL